MPDVSKTILKPPAVAKILGCGEQAVREHLKRGLWDFGEYIPKGKRGRKTNEYNIPVAKLEAYIGRPLREDEIR